MRAGSIGVRGQQMDRLFASRQAVEDGNQFPAPQILRDHPQRKLCEPEPRPHRVEQHLEIADLVFHRHDLRGEASVGLLQQPRNVVRMPPANDAVMPGQVCLAGRRAARREIVRSAADHQMMHAERTRNQIGRVVQVADAYR